MLLKLLKQLIEATQKMWCHLGEPSRNGMRFQASTLTNVESDWVAGHGSHLNGAVFLSSDARRLDDFDDEVVISA